MMKVTWIIDEEFDSAGTNVKKLAQEVIRQQHDVLFINRDNVNKVLSRIDNKKPYIYYGGLRLSYQLNVHADLFPGLYISFEYYKCTNYYLKYGDNLLNSDYILLPYKDLIRQKKFIYDIFSKNGEVFVRSNRGTKILPSVPVKYYELDHYLSLYNLHDSELLLVSSPKKIEKEWRFLIGDYIIDYSQYRPHIDNSSDWRVIDTVGHILNTVQYRPDSVYTIDMCETNDGELKLLEINSFSCAGLYGMNLSTVVWRVNQIVIRDYEEMAA